LHEKFILKEAFHGLIPDSITRRAKQPYRAPIRELFSTDAPPDYVDELLSENCLKNSGYFNAVKVRRLLEKYRQPDNGFSSEFQNMALIGVLSTQILHRQFVEGVPPRATERISPDKVIDRSRERTT